MHALVISRGKRISKLFRLTVERCAVKDYHKLPSILCNILNSRLLHMVCNFLTTKLPFNLSFAYLQYQRCLSVSKI